MLRVSKPSASLYLSLFLLVALNSSKLGADTIVIGGAMHTTATLTDRFVLHIPLGVAKLYVRIPILNIARSNHGVLEESATCSGVNISSSLPTSSEQDILGAAGNTYRLLTYEHPASGTLLIDAKFDNLNLTTDLNRPLPNIALPIPSVPPEIAPYLAPSKLAESANPQVQSLARQITAGSQTEAAATLAITAWMQRNIVYGITGATLKTDALDTLNRREAACDGWAHLFIALARADGIPARFVGGYALAGTLTYPLSADGDRNLLVTSDTLSHSWVEVWYPGAGWVPYDPQSSAGFADTHHIPIWTAPDADGGLPLLLWRTTTRTPTKFSIAEEQYAEGITDQMSMNYLRSENGPAGITTLTRRNM